MNTDRETVTGSIETDKGPDPLIQVLSDPRRIPQWASGYSYRAEPDKSGCERVIKVTKASPIEAAPFNPARTVDSLCEVTPGKREELFSEFCLECTVEANSR